MVAEYTGGQITRHRAEYFHQDHPGPAGTGQALGNTRLVFSDFNQDGIVGLGEDDPATPLNELEITQESHYYPFGMNHLGPWYETVAPENKYLYNGKELNGDYEINLMDYGARWYDPAVGRFTTTDRFAEKYYPLSPYGYAAGNPVKFVDVNGDSIKINGVIYVPGQTYEGDNEFVKATFTALNYLLDNGADATEIIERLAAHEDNHIDILPSNKEHNPYYRLPGAKTLFSVNEDNINDGKPAVLFHPYMAMQFMESRDYSFLKYWFGNWGKRSPAEGLLHELGHADSYFSNPAQHKIDTRTKVEYYGKLEERQVIDAVENPAAKALRPDSYIPRTHHGGQYYPVSSPISIEKK